MPGTRASATRTMMCVIVMGAWPWGELGVCSGMAVLLVVLVAFQKDFLPQRRKGRKAALGIRHRCFFAFFASLR
jgi:hypothetical protein